MAEESQIAHADDGEGLPYRPTYMLTTFDNPYDPFTQWDQWLVWDTSAGYNTCGFLARIAKTSVDLSELDEFLAIQNAIDEIVRENVSGMHRKVKRGDLTKPADE